MCTSTEGLYDILDGRETEFTGVKTLGKRSLGSTRRNLEVSIAMGLEKLDREYWT